jgi:hypothetical protein
MCGVKKIKGEGEKKEFSGEKPNRRHHPIFTD